MERETGFEPATSSSGIFVSIENKDKWTPLMGWRVTRRLSRECVFRVHYPILIRTAPPLKRKQMRLRDWLEYAV